jgi:hypothetical protein
MKKIQLLSSLYFVNNHFVQEDLSHVPGEALIRRWFALSFCTLFLALHSSARNHATRFSMFFSSSKKVKNEPFIANILGKCICIAGAGIETPRPPLQATSY